MANGYVVKREYFINGHVIEFAGFVANEEGDPVARFLVYNEDKDLVETFSLSRSKLIRREDVTYAAEKKLGIARGSSQTPPGFAVSAVEAAPAS